MRTHTGVDHFENSFLSSDLQDIGVHIGTNGPPTGSFIRQSYAGLCQALQVRHKQPEDVCRPGLAPLTVRNNQIPKVTLYMPRPHSKAFLYLHQGQQNEIVHCPPVIILESWLIEQQLQGNSLELNNFPCIDTPYELYWGLSAWQMHRQSTWFLLCEFQAKWLNNARSTLDLIKINFGLGPAILARRGELFPQ